MSSPTPSGRLIATRTGPMQGRRPSEPQDNVARVLDHHPKLVFASSPMSEKPEPPATTGKKAPRTAAERRAERLAHALRDNLKRRKAQARERAEEPSSAIPHDKPR